jgi:formylglycine-generating enzyme required for sulfatase activity
MLLLLFAAALLFFAWSSRRDAAAQGQYLKSLGMRLISGGCYDMGDPSKNPLKGGLPLHRVCLDPFYLKNDLVTVGEFGAFVRESGYRTESERSGGCHVLAGLSTEMERSATWRHPGYPQTDSNPVVCVSWRDAGRFIDWIVRKSPKQGMAFRLPTEGEWEFAARNRGERVAGDFPPRASLLFHRPEDQGEWLADWFVEADRARPETNPSGPGSGKYKVFRGAARADEKGSGLYARYRREPDYRSNDLGFRLALSMTDR